MHIHSWPQVFIRRNSVYIATIIVGAFVGERVSGGGSAAADGWGCSAGGRGWQGGAPKLQGRSVGVHAC